jgi:hypothetical protein
LHRHVAQRGDEDLRGRHALNGQREVHEARARVLC